MTPEEKQLQGLDFAYGNLACSSSHKPQREAFQKVASGKIPDKAFDAWAADKTWWLPTRGTDERHAIRELVDHRGARFTMALLKAANLDEETVAKVYYGLDITEADFAALRKVLKERLTRD